MWDLLGPYKTETDADRQLNSAVKERKSRTGARSQHEKIRDLLAPSETETDAQSPVVSLRQLPVPTKGL